MAGQTASVDVTLVSTATLSISLLDAARQPTDGDLQVEALEAPLAPGTAPWSRPLAASAAGPTSIRVPVGAFRVTFPGDNLGGPSGADGVLVADEVRDLPLLRGSHVRLPQSFVGSTGEIYQGEGDARCDNVTGLCAPFPLTTITAVDQPDYAKPELGGAGLRSLLAAGSGLRVRRLLYVPPSGAFARTVTLMTNPGTAPVTVTTESHVSAPLNNPTFTTPDGDAFVEAGETYALMTDANAKVAFIVGTDTTDAWTSNGSEGEPGIFVYHTVTIPPGETRALMLFSIIGAPDSAYIDWAAVSFGGFGHPDELLGLSPSERAAIVNFALPTPPATSVSGHVTHGGAVPQAEVALVDEWGQVVAEGQADDTGLFTFEGFPPGTYRLTALDPATLRTGRTDLFAVADGETAQQDVTLDEDTTLGTVHVVGTLDSGGPASGALVRLTVDEFPLWWRSVVLDGDGLADVPGVPPGHVAASSGTPPDFGWDGAALTAGGSVDLAVVIGSRYRPPVSLGDPFLKWNEGDTLVADYCCGSYGAVDGEYFPARLGIRLGDGSGGQETAVGPAVTGTGGLKVTRRSFRPYGADYLRLLDVIENPTAGPITFEYRLDSWMGPLTLITTGSGDTALGVDDDWAFFSNPSGTSKKDVALVYAGRPPPARHDALQEDATEHIVSSTWHSLTLQPGETKILMQFLVAGDPSDPATTQAQAQALTAPDETALSGLTAEERSQVVNFAVPPIQ